MADEWYDGKRDMWRDLAVVVVPVVAVVVVAAWVVKRFVIG